MPFPPSRQQSTGSPARPVGPISNSAAPPFRAKKKKPGEVNPPPQNAGRLTGPPMQKGPGAGSMFADGRKGQPQYGMPPRTPNYPTSGPGVSRVSGQPQYGMPPSPNYPMGGPVRRGVSGQPQGSMPPGTPNYPVPMLADGGFGSPQPMGGAPDDQDNTPDMDDSQPDAQGPPQGAGGGGMGEMPVISPDAVAYHDDPRSCGQQGSSPGCQYFGQDGNCQVLQMQVAAEGACNAFSAGQGGGADMGPGGGPMGQTGASFAQNPDGGSGSPQLG